MSKEFWKNLNVHKSFLEDKARNDTYFHALQQLSKTHRTAVDIGSGTGILSFLAAKAGFKKVTGIEQTDLVKLARKACEANELQDVVSFIEADLFATLLEEKADVILHDQIGDFVWNEDIVRKIDYAKKHFLKPGGVVLPFKIDVYFVPVSQISDLDQSNLKQQKVFLKNDSCFLADPQLACTLDFTGQPVESVSISMKFKLKSDAVCAGVIGFMKIHFTEKISLSTAPSETITNWGQFFLPATGQHVRHKGEIVNFSLKASSESKNWHWQIN